MARSLCLLAAALCGAAFPAGAAITVIGNSYARSCYEAAEQERHGPNSLRECDMALNESALSSRDRAATHVNRGILLMYEKDLTGAIADFNKALEIDAALPEAFVNRGIAHLHLGGRDEQAVADLTRGIELDASRPEIAYYTRAVANEIMGEVRAAYEDYRMAARLKPEWDEPRKQLQRFEVRTAG